MDPSKSASSAAADKKISGMVNLANAVIPLGKLKDKGRKALVDLLDSVNIMKTLISNRSMD